MHYPTIVLELLQDEYPRLHSRLEPTQQLHRAVDDYAAWLEGHHASWMNRLNARRADRDPNQLASDALELAIADLREDISYSPPVPGAETDEPLSLEAAMAYLRRATRVGKSQPQLSAHSAAAGYAPLGLSGSPSEVRSRFQWRNLIRTVKSALLGSGLAFHPEPAPSI